MEHETLTNKLSTNEKRARLAVEGTNLYPEIYLLGFKLLLNAFAPARHAVAVTAQHVWESNMVRVFKIYQTAFILITRQYWEINEKIKLSTPATNHSNSIKLHIWIKEMFPARKLFWSRMTGV